MNRQPVSAPAQKRGMERKDQVSQDDIAEILQLVFKDAKYDQSSLIRMMEQVYRPTLIDLARSNDFDWKKRYSTEGFQLNKNRFFSDGETFLGLIGLTQAEKLQDDLIRLMLLNQDNLADLDWEILAYLEYENLNALQIQALVKDLASYRLGGSQVLNYLNKLHGNKCKSFNEQARLGMFRYFHSIIPTLKNKKYKETTYEILSLMLVIYNRDAKYLSQLGVNVSYGEEKDCVVPEPVVHVLFLHIDIYENKAVVENLILNFPDMSFVLKLPSFDWKYKESGNDGIWNILFLLLKWCSKKGCSTDILNRLCDDLCLVGYSMRCNSPDLFSGIYQFNQSYFNHWAARFLNILIERHQNDTGGLSTSLSEYFLSSSNQAYFPKLIEVLNELSEDKKMMICEALILSDAITANNIMLFYQGMTREESSTLAQLLIKYQKPLQFFKHNDSEFPYSFRLGSAQMPRAPLALTQEALSCNFKGADEKRGGEQLNMLGWLLFYDLLPVSKLKDVAMKYPLKCHLSIHQGFVGSFPSHNHYLAIDEKTKLTKELIGIIMLYHAHPDLIHAIPMLAQAQDQDRAQVIEVDENGNRLPPPLPGHVLGDRKTPGL